MVSDNVLFTYPLNEIQIFSKTKLLIQIYFNDFIYLVVYSSKNKCLLSESQLYFILNYDQDIFCDEDGVREFKNNATCPACKLAFNCDNSSSYFLNNHFHTL